MSICFGWSARFGVFVASLGAAILLASAPSQAQYFGWWDQPPPRRQISRYPAPRRYEPPATLRAVAPAPVVRPAARETTTTATATLPAGPLGPLQLVVSLPDQRMTIYAQGRPIATTRVSSGQSGYETPTGLFTIIEKRRYHESNIYSGAPMPFMQRITYSGIALHQGVVPGHPASHGCIRLPVGFAEQLFAMTTVGARVVVTRQPIVPVPIAHPALFAYKPRAETAGTDDRLPEDEGLAAIETIPDRASLPVRLASAATTTRTDALRAEAQRAARVTRAQSAPVSVFVSRKEGRVFVRRRMEPILEAPVTFRDPDQPLGTHVYTAIAMETDGTTMRWNVMTPESGAEHATEPPRRRGEPARAPMLHRTLDARAALEAIELPPYAIERISEMLLAGSSLIISDHGLSGETARKGGTDFIVLTKE